MRPPTHLTPVQGGSIYAGIKAGLLDETPENFLAADLSLAAIKNLEYCQHARQQLFARLFWTRTVTNVSGDGQAGSCARSNADGIKLAVELSSIHLAAGESAAITVTANSAFTVEDWNFGRLVLSPDNDDLVKLRMPIALFAASRNPFVDYAVTPSEASKISKPTP